jgi:hypothetical protein
MPASDDLRSVSDNPTGAGDIPVVSTAQVENVVRPGGREQHPGGVGESSDERVRPGGQEGGAASSKDGGSMFVRPGGSEGWS